MTTSRSPVVMVATLQEVNFCGNYWWLLGIANGGGRFGGLSPVRLGCWTCQNHGNMAVCRCRLLDSRVLRCRRQLSVDPDDGRRCSIWPMPAGSTINWRRPCAGRSGRCVRRSGPTGWWMPERRKVWPMCCWIWVAFEEAETWFRQADPAFCLAEVQWNRSRVALARGDLPRAWQLAEGRWLSDLTRRSRSQGFPHPLLAGLAGVRGGGGLG